VAEDGGIEPQPLQAEICIKYSPEPSGFTLRPQRALSQIYLFLSTKSVILNPNVCGIRMTISVLVCFLFFVICALHPKGVFATNSGPFSVGLWVNPTSSIATKALVAKAEELRVVTDGSGNPACQIMVSSAWQTAATSSTALTLNTWSHVSCTYDKVTVRIFVNGVQTGTQALTTVSDDTANVFRIGQDDSSGTTYGNLTGTVDNFQFYNYARTSKQIVEDLNAGHPAGGSPVGSAIGHWKFDEGQGITANNAGFGGSTLNGTLTTMASPATATSGWTNSGKFAKALNFDGTSDYVNAGSSSNLNLAGATTISAWVKSAVTTGSTYEDVVARGGVFTNNTAYAFGIRLQGSNDSRVYFYWRNGATLYGTEKSSTVIANQQWHHIVGVRDDLYNLSLYLDGVLLGTDVSNSVAVDGGQSTYIGWGTEVDSGEGPFNGSIDEVKIYNGALTAAEVKIDYNRGASIVLGALSDNSSYEKSAANQEYCVPGDTTSCVAPVGEWKLDEGTGTSANDTSGNANTGTLGTGSSAPTWSTGKIGKGLNFDGTDDYVSVADSSSLSPSQVTVETWAKFNSIADGKTIVAKDKSSGQSYMIAIGVANAGYLEFATYNGAWYGAKVLSSTISTNTWYHIVGSYDGTNLRLYVNGVLQNTASGPASIDYTAGLSDKRLTIGRYYASGIGSNYFNGSVDEVKIYNYARTAAQVAWDYNRGGPVARYKLDECAGPTANDASGNGNNGTITIGSLGSQSSLGTCVDGSSTSAWYNGATGKFNSSLNFDGTDDYVDTTTGDIVSSLGAISAWINIGAYGTVGDSYIHVISSQVTSGGDSDFKLQIGDGTDGGKDNVLIDRVLNGTDSYSISTTNLSLSTWYHVVGTWDGSTVRLYVNGILEDSDSASGAIPAADTAVYKIGVLGSSAVRHWEGKLDDVRIYNYALSAAQVKTVMNDGSAVRFGPNTGAP